MKITSKQLQDYFIAVIIGLLLTLSVLCLANAQVQQLADDEMKEAVTQPYILYKNITQVVPIYKEVDNTVTYQCWDNSSKFITCENKTVTQVFDHMETQVISSTPDKIISKTGQIIEQPAYIDEKSGMIIRLSYPMPARNLKEFGRCTDYEKVKEVCHEID